MLNTLSTAMLSSRRTSSVKPFLEVQAPEVEPPGWRGSKLGLNEELPQFYRSVDKAVKIIVVDTSRNTATVTCRQVSKQYLARVVQRATLPLLT